MCSCFGQNILDVTGQCGFGELEFQTQKCALDVLVSLLVSKHLISSVFATQDQTVWIWAGSQISAGTLVSTVLS